MGWDIFHVAVDDARPLSHVEVLPDEGRASTADLVPRALGWFGTQGYKVERVMTGNGSAYRSRRFQKTLGRLAIRHIYTRLYTPKTNGKAEAFIQPLLREGAYGSAHPSSAARNADLPR